MSRRGIVRCAIAAVLFGISAPAASRLARDMGAFSLAGLLYLGAAIAVLPVVGRRFPTRHAVQRSAVKLGVAVVVGGAMGPVLLAAGLSHAPAATASLLLNLELVFTTLLAYAVFKEHIGHRVAGGTVMVVIAGIVLGWSSDADLRWGAILIAVPVCVGEWTTASWLHARTALEVAALTRSHGATISFERAVSGATGPGDVHANFANSVALDVEVHSLLTSKLFRDTHDRVNESGRTRPKSALRTRWPCTLTPAAS